MYGTGAVRRSVSDGRFGVGMRNHASGRAAEGAGDAGGTAPKWPGPEMAGAEM